MAVAKDLGKAGGVAVEDLAASKPAEEPGAFPIREQVEQKRRPLESTNP